MGLGGLRRGDVVLVVLKGDYGKPRPAVVVQSDALNVGSVVVCPCTSDVTGAGDFRVAVAPTAETGLDRTSEIMVEKLAAVARSSVRGVVGRLEAAAMREVERALLLVLGFA